MGLVGSQFDIDLVFAIGAAVGLAFFYQFLPPRLQVGHFVRVLSCGERRRGKAGKRQQHRGDGK
ncbi:MAG TPA: hypothetical protein PKW44_05530 [Methylophilaceae bacterium]|nr:hypothetical protein [Methylophilaceae bacterium]